MKGMTIMCKNTSDNLGIFEFLGYTEDSRDNKDSKYIKKDIGSDHFIYVDTIDTLDKDSIIESLKDPSEEIALHLLILDSGMYFFEVTEDCGNYKKGQIYGNLEYQSNIMPKSYERTLNIENVIEYIRDGKY